MEKNSNKMRVTCDHKEIILSFSEKNPEIITNKFASHLQGREANQKLWGDLTSSLNSLGHGLRSIEGWKKTISDWKSKTKIKASKLNQYIKQTGGGPSSNVNLTAPEERLLQIMGKASTFGDDTVAEKGIKRPLVEEKENIPEKIKSTLVVNEDEDILSFEEESIPSTSTNTPQEAMTKSPQMSSKQNSFKKGKTTNLDKDVQIMHKEILVELKNINANIGRLASALELIANRATFQF